MPKKSESEIVEEVKVQPKGWVAIKDFVLGQTEYKAGDSVNLPAEYTEDVSFDEFRNEKRKSVDEVGTAFSYLGEWIDKKANERQVMREILPIKKV